MKILITGGSGFVGTNLMADLLALGHGVVNYDFRQSQSFPEQTFIGDVCNGETLARIAQGGDAIFHLAAEHRDDVRPIDRYYQVNVEGAKAVVAAAETNRIDTIVFTSTVAVYGLNVGVPIETSPVRPFNDYGQSKYEAEKVFQSWAGSAGGRRLVIVRPSVIFGENNRGNVYTLLKQIETERFVLVGAGRNRKSMAYVKNVSQFLVRCLSLKAGSHLFNYADKPDITTAELIDTARNALSKKKPPRVPYVLGLAGGYAFDLLSAATGRTFPISAVRARKFCADTRIGTDHCASIDILPRYSLQEGLRRTIAHEFPK